MSSSVLSGFKTTRRSRVVLDLIKRATSFLNGFKNIPEKVILGDPGAVSRGRAKFCPHPTDCPWVSEDVKKCVSREFM